jgi:hypothetical protein
MNGIRGLGWLLAAALVLVPGQADAVPVGTAFTYQGVVQKNGNGINGTCSFRFTLYDGLTAGSQVGAPNPNTISATADHGVFTVTLDFGASAFDGNARWLEIAVEGPGDLSYTTLTPRQPVTPVPYALYALNPPANSSGWSLTGNGGTTSSNFLGTTDNQSLELRVKSLRAMRLAFAGGTFRNSINTLGGVSVNTLSGSPIGATISGGGLYDGINPGGNQPNTVGADLGSIGGGGLNTVVGAYGTVPGGFGNTASGYSSFAAGQLATASHDGSFVWGDGTQAVNSSATHSFDVLATGGVNFLTAGNTLKCYGPWIVASGLADERAYLGGDGAGGDVQLGSLNPAVSVIACYNAGNGSYMDVVARTLTITGGGDLAEPFPISGAGIPEGSVVIIDDEHAGQLRLSAEPYDTRVAGVVSGAGGIHPGVSLRQQGKLDAGQNVALTGRVYVLADASNGPIQPGDLLTTSATPGRAMMVTDFQRARGAILGKAMSGLNSGKGLVLVLVSLQ